MGLVLAQEGNNGFSEPISRMDIGSSLDGDFRYLLNREKVDEPRLATPTTTPEVDERLATLSSTAARPPTEAINIGCSEVYLDQDSRCDTQKVICSFPWPCEQALRVAQCESGFDPQAVGGGGIYIGLWQIWVGHNFTDRDLFDPIDNTEAAWILYQQRGWNPWPVCQ